MLLRQTFLHRLNDTFKLALDLCPDYFFHLVVWRLPWGEIFWRHLTNQLPQAFNKGPSFGRHFLKIVYLNIKLKLPHVAAAADE